jgi:hypothetical protein
MWTSARFQHQRFKEIICLKFFKHYRKLQIPVQSVLQFRKRIVFEALMKSAEGIALKLVTDPIFPQVRVRPKRRLFDCKGANTPLIGEDNIQNQIV